MSNRLFEGEAFATDWHGLYDSIEKRKYLVQGAMVVGDRDVPIQDHKVCAMGSLISDCSLIKDSAKNNDICIGGSCVSIQHWDKHEKELRPKVEKLVKSGFFHAWFYTNSDYSRTLSVALSDDGDRVMERNDGFDGPDSERRAWLLRFIKEKIKHV